MSAPTVALPPELDAAGYFLDSELTPDGWLWLWGIDGEMVADGFGTALGALAAAVEDFDERADAEDDPRLLRWR